MPKKRRTLGCGGNADPNPPSPRRRLAVLTLSRARVHVVAASAPPPPLPLHQQKEHRRAANRAGPLPIERSSQVPCARLHVTCSLLFVQLPPLLLRVAH
eukprot:229897-Chlamydomonas_euryale.AAC.12